MADFSNPLQVQNLSAPSIQRPVVDTTGQQVAGFLADALSLVRAPKGPSQSSIDEDLKTQGSQLAVQQLKRFTEIENTEDRSAAKRYLNSVVLESQTGMSDTTRQAYYGVFKEQLGGSFLAEDEKNRRDIEAGQIQQLEGYRSKGAELAAAQGYNPEELDQNQLLILGQMDAGQASLIAREQQEVALKSSKLNLADRERLIVSNSVYQKFSADTESGLRAALMGYSTAVQKNPNSRMQLTSDLVTNLKLQQTSLQNQLASQLNQSGGNLSDIGADQLNRISSNIDTVIQILDGTIPLKLSETELSRLSVDSALSFTADPGNNSVSRAMLINNALKVPLNSMNEVLKYYSGGSSTQSVRDTVARQTSDGLARAASTYSLKPEAVKQNYVMLGDTIRDLGTSPSPQVVADAGTTLVNNMLEGISAPAKVRGVANSAYALPSMLSGLAKTVHPPQLSEAVQTAAAAEGVEPSDIWIESARTLMREKIAPSLQLHDQNYTKNLDIRFEGGRFKVDYKVGFQDTSRQFVGNPALRVPVLSGARQGQLPLSADAQKRAADLSRVLNDYAMSYARVMNARAEDVGPALEAAVRLSLGLTNLQTEEN